MSRNCANCGSEFTATGKGSSNKRFCSAKCKWRYNNSHRRLKPNISANCDVCGKPFERYVEPSKIACGRAKGLYCSLKCKGVAFRNDRHPLWKGGRIVESDGYVMALNPNHPHANNKGYVFEHRLVMEEQIGRYLEPQEVVHHINGIRSDNRPENLHLYQSNADHKRDDISFRTRDEKGRLLPL